MGPAILQDQGPVAYASKVLSETQQRYAQIAKELLAVVFECKRFHQHAYGNQIIVESDHKPLEAILRKPLYQAPSRLQKFLLQLQEYNITLVYKKGTLMNIADELLRPFTLEVTQKQFEKDIKAEKYIHFMSQDGYVTGHNLEETKREIAGDESMQMLIQQIHHWLA